MASTYSDLKIELIGTGEQVGTWGATTNTNLGTAIEEAITGSADIAFSSADVEITLSNTNGTQAARNLRLVCTGTSGGDRNLILGSGCQIEKIYLVQNDLADSVTVINGDGAGGTSGTGVTIPTGGKRFVFNDGTNVVEAVNTNLSNNVSGVLPIANGGTNATATPTSGGVAYGTGTAYAITSAGTTNQILKSNGTSAPSWINQSAVTAGAATQIDIDATTSSDTSTYPVLVGAASTGNQTPFVDTGLSYNASTNAMTATTFVGALSGNATTATSATNATNATNVNISATTSTDTSTYPMLVSAASTGNQAPFVDTGLVYNASTNALTATTFVGALSGNASTVTTITTAQVTGATAGASALAVGTYAFLRNLTSPAKLYGDTQSGGNLSVCNAAGVPYVSSGFVVVVSGSWRCMGRADSGTVTTGGVPGQCTMWLRYA